jgi:N-acetylglutamate synthase-like GNAT family acetyltransferase
MVIRQTTIEDIGILVEILRKAFTPVAERFGLTIENCPNHNAFCSRKKIEEDFVRQKKFFILEENDMPCGCVAIEYAKPGVCYLERLAVLPQHRNKGFGTALVRHIFQQAKNADALSLEIGIMAQDSELQKWYEKLGFIPKTVRKYDHLPFTVAFLAAKTG